VREKVSRRRDAGCCPSYRSNYWTNSRRTQNARLLPKPREGRTAPHRHSTAPPQPRTATTPHRYSPTPPQHRDGHVLPNRLRYSFRFAPLCYSSTVTRVARDEPWLTSFATTPADKPRPPSCWESEIRYIPKIGDFRGLRSRRPRQCAPVWRCHRARAAKGRTRIAVPINRRPSLPASRLAGVSR
jgi:hypothetical protein